MKKVIIFENGGTAIVSDKGVDIQVSSPSGNLEKTEMLVEDKDIKHLDKIKKDGLKEIRKLGK